MGHLCAKSREDPTKNEGKLMFPTSEFYKKDVNKNRVGKYPPPCQEIYLKLGATHVALVTSR